MFKLLLVIVPWIFGFQSIAYSEPLSMLVVEDVSAKSSSAKKQFFHRLSRENISHHITIDDADKVPEIKKLCYLGDGKAICKMTKHWNKISNQAYDRGLHQKTQILSCRGDEVLETEWELLHDWVPEAKKRTWSIKACKEQDFKDED
jgi:hypothetical protein